MPLILSVLAKGMICTWEIEGKVFPVHTNRVFTFSDSFSLFRMELTHNGSTINQSDHFTI